MEKILIGGFSYLWILHGLIPLCAKLGYSNFITSFLACSRGRARIEYFKEMCQVTQEPLSLKGTKV